MSETAIKYKFDVDHATIEFKVGDVVLTTYTLEDSIVTIPVLAKSVDTSVASSLS